MSRWFHLSTKTSQLCQLRDVNSRDTTYLQCMHNVRRGEICSMFSKPIDGPFDCYHAEDGIKHLYSLEQIFSCWSVIRTCAAIIHLSSIPNTLTSFMRTQHRTNKVTQVSARKVAVAVRIVLLRDILIEWPPWSYPFDRTIRRSL